ncbi:alpha/beta fold hydrolase [Williamsia phyllosphaerae]|uniref:Hydrolase, alpha/beta fold family protein n=1 Tax=Williamsia phyllosphaerae TaxID=885042 RepID=A0ABQ1ULD9_9NOCA|nr:putative hydrolase, alpha/beta fold family protein [Williamsia phyllosphaerae]
MVAIVSTVTADSGSWETGLRDHGSDAGDSAPTIVLLHGLMGRGRTWRRQIPWLRRHGRVFTVDAAWHTGAGSIDLDDVAADEIATERFVADVAECLVWIDRGPAVLIGHSMGGLHAWCTAAQYPELVAALVVEDMAPDFRGQTTRSWTPWFSSWPDRFATRAQADEMFGPVAGRYFYEAFDDGRLHGDLEIWAAIAEEWGQRDFWAQWEQVEAPTLLLEAEFSVTPDGQMARMAETNPHATHLAIPGAGHLVHDDKPAVYRGAVEAFLSGVL